MLAIESRNFFAPTLVMTSLLLMSSSLSSSLSRQNDDNAPLRCACRTIVALSMPDRFSTSCSLLAPLFLLVFDSSFLLLVMLPSEAAGLVADGADDEDVDVDAAVDADAVLLLEMLLEMLTLAVAASFCGALEVALELLLEGNVVWS